MLAGLAPAPSPAHCCIPYLIRFRRQNRLPCWARPATKPPLDHTRLGTRTSSIHAPSAQDDPAPHPHHRHSSPLALQCRFATLLSFLASAGGSSSCLWIGEAEQTTANMAAPKMTKNQMRRAKKKEQKKTQAQVRNHGPLLSSMSSY